MNLNRQQIEAAKTEHEEKLKRLSPAMYEALATIRRLPHDDASTPDTCARCIARRALLPIAARVEDA